MIKRLLFKIARSPVAGLFIGFAFARLTRLMPLARIMEDKAVIVFEHPKPFWETHWLAVPKQRVPSIMAANRETLGNLLPMIQHAAAQLDAPVMLVNAGEYQDVPQLHFHLTSGPDIDGGVWGSERFCGDSAEILTISKHPKPTRTVHWQIHAPTLPSFDAIDWSHRTQRELAIDAMIAAREQANQLDLPAFTILWHSAENHFTLHLVAGDRIERTMS